jgi:hypothetical protein
MPPLASAPTASSSWPGLPSLRDDQDVKGNVERARDLGCDGDAATGKAEHDDVTSVREAAEFGGEQLACFGTVAKTLLGD